MTKNRTNEALAEQIQGLINSLGASWYELNEGAPDDCIEQELDGMDNVDKLRLAQDLLGLCIELSQSVVDDTDDGNAEAYIVDHLRIMHSEDHGYMSRDLNFDEWIQRVERGGEDEDEDYEEEDEEDEEDDDEPRRTATTKDDLDLNFGEEG